MRQLYHNITTVERDTINIKTEPKESFVQLADQIARMSLTNDSSGTAIGTKDDKLSLVDKVDSLIKAFKEGTAPVIPRVQWLNEAMKVYIDSGQLDKAHALIQTMDKDCKMLYFVRCVYFIWG